MKIKYFAALGVLVFAAVFSTLCRAQVPVFDVTPLTSTIKFSVTASVPIAGNFDKWDASLVFGSAAATSAVLDIKIDAATVNTGSGMKNNKLKSKDFFDVAQNPYITFKSTKLVQTGPATFDVFGTFTIRGISKPETLKLVVSGKGTGNGSIKGTMAFDRKDFGMNSGIPFIKIADRVEVNIDLQAKQVSGPKVTYQQ